MNIFPLVENTLTHMRASVQNFFRDVRRLLQASPIFGGVVVLSGVILGFGPMLWLQFFAKFIDASYSARGVGTVTSDLTHAGIWIAILSVLLFLASVYVAQTKGLSRAIVLTIMVWTISITHTIAIIPVTKAFLVFLIILTLGFIFIKDRIGRVVLHILIFGLALITIVDLLFMMTRRSFSVGSMLEYTGVVLSLSILAIVISSRKLRTLLCAS